MYGVNDTVLYGANGVCRVVGISELEHNGGKKSYYVLKPVSNETATVYVPLDNDRLTGRMRRILSAEEIYELIRSMPSEEPVWIEDDQERKQAYREMISCGDPHKLVQMVKALYRRRETQAEKGRKFHAADAQLMREAEKILYDEFALVLNIQPDQVLPFILRQIEPEPQTD